MKPFTFYFNFCLILLSPLILAGTAGASAKSISSSDRIQFEETKEGIIGLVTLPQFVEGGEGTVRLWGRPQRGDTPDLIIKDRNLLLLELYSYDMEGALVFERKGLEWFRVKMNKTHPSALASGAPWIHQSDAGQFIPIENFLLHGLTYLKKNWDGRVYQEPHSRNFVQVEREGIEEQPVIIQRAKWIQGQLWLKVRILEGEYCQLEAPVPREQGWIKAHDSSQEMVAWFYPLGC